jgi:hypothetical protein
MNGYRDRDFLKYGLHYWILLGVLMKNEVYNNKK